MSFRTFLLGLSVSFGVAWLAVVIIPYYKMRGLEPIVLTEEADGEAGVFIAKRAGRVANGSLVYGENGCYLCHTQVVRPTYAGNDMFRPDWGGLADDEVRGDTRRETNVFDFEGEKFAHIGVSRLGPDLSNVGRRVEAIYAKDGDAEEWLMTHLYNPRHWAERRDSTCPSHRFLFDETEVKGNRSAGALPFEGKDGKQIVPGSEARALVSYLLSLKKDHAVPAALDFSPKTAAPAPAASPEPVAAPAPAAGPEPAGSPAPAAN